MSYDSSSAQIAPAPVLAALGVEETASGASSMMLDEKERLDLREVLRLSIGDHVSGFSEGDLDDLGVTLLEVTAIALKTKHSQN